ncbi:MAG: FMN-binding protein, partial [Lachnospiraceae bacterium]|nr:FMN-binding protein [Lachnospiraceae bacterium]
MNKKTIIVFILFAVLSALYLIFNERIYEFISDRFMLEEIFDYKSGEATGEKGKIGLKIRVDNSGAIKEVVVTEHTDSEIAINALQKLIDSSLDKQSADEIDAVSGATDTSETYKKIISKL